MLHIGGKKFKVKWKKTLTDVDLHGGAELLGKANSSLCEIWLTKNMATEKAKEVLLHEALHMIDIDCNLNLGENKVNTLAIEILRLITQNNLNFLK